MQKNFLILYYAFYDFQVVVILLETKLTCVREKLVTSWLVNKNVLAGKNVVKGRKFEH